MDTADSVTVPAGNAVVGLRAFRDDLRNNELKHCKPTGERHRQTNDQSPRSSVERRIRKFASAAEHDPPQEREREFCLFSSVRVLEEESSTRTKAIGFVFHGG